MMAGNTVQLSFLLACAWSGSGGISGAVPDGEVRLVREVLGTPLVRKEDPALLSGRGRFADDLPVPAGTLHAHVIRSPHAHARIIGIEATDALAQEGVWAVIT